MRAVSLQMRGSGTFGVVCVLCVAVASGACRDRKAESAEPEQVADPVELAPLVPLAMGKPSLAGYAYSLGDARPAFKRAIAANERHDWAAEEAACRDALATDPGHLEASWHLALALARQGEFAAVAEPLSRAVAGDWMRWGERSLKARGLAKFRDTAHGRQWAALVERYRAEFREVVGRALLVIGRRGRPWYPRHAGSQPINHRSELYAYDFDTERYLRLSRTNGSFVGYTRAPDGSTLIYASYRKLVMPARESEPGVREPYIKELRVGAIGLDSMSMSRREVTLENVSWAEIGYARAAGDTPMLVARVMAAHTRREQVYRLDIAHGRAHLIDGPGPSSPTLRVEYDLAQRLATPVPGLLADWDEGGVAGAFRLDVTRRTVALPGGQAASGHSMQWSPSRARLAFSTVAAEPCADDPSARRVVLYAVDAATGKLRQLATGEGDMAPLWLDDDRLAYVDNETPQASVRVVHATTGERLAHLQGRGGVNTDRLISTQACRLRGIDPDDREYAVEDLSGR